MSSLVTAERIHTNVSCVDVVHFYCVFHNTDHSSFLLFNFTHKITVGDLSAEVKKRTKARVLDFTGKDEWHFGDIAREVNNRRQEWAKAYLGEEVWKNYESGDFTKKVLSDLKALKNDYSVGEGKC